MYVHSHQEKEHLPQRKLPYICVLLIFTVESTVTYSTYIGNLEYSMQNAICTVPSNIELN